jgi:hypothetical protein
MKPDETGCQCSNTAKLYKSNGCRSLLPEQNRTGFLRTSGFIRFAPVCFNRSSDFTVSSDRCGECFFARQELDEPVANSGSTYQKREVNSRLGRLGSLGGRHDRQKPSSVVLPQNVRRITDF